MARTKQFDIVTRPVCYLKVVVLEWLSECSMDIGKVEKRKWKNKKMFMPYTISQCKRTTHQSTASSII